MVRKLPADDELRELAERYTDGEIAEMFAPVTPQAVQYRRKRAKPPIPAMMRQGETRQPSYKAFIPWSVALRHQNHFLARALRVHGKYLTVGELTDKEQKLLAGFWDRLADLRDDPTVENFGTGSGAVVVCYDRDDPEGFYLSRAREGEFLIRP